MKQLIASDQRITMAINPMMAQIMLEYNSANRPLSNKRIDVMAKDMSEGCWVLTGENLIFSREGILNNGQHRLCAATLSTKPFVTDVRFGISREAFMHIDTGRKRTQADALSIVGEKRCTTLSAALAWIYRYQNGLPNAARDHCSIEATLLLLEQHPHIRDSVKIAMDTTQAFSGFQAGPMSFAHYAMSLKSRDEADEFFFHLESGLGILSKRDPIFRLRQRVLQARSSKLLLRPVDQIALTFKAWNALRMKQDVQQLSWRATGTRAEPFPIPI